MRSEAETFRRRATDQVLAIATSMLRRTFKFNKGELNEPLRGAVLVADNGFETNNAAKAVWVSSDFTVPEPLFALSFDFDKTPQVIRR